MLALSIGSAWHWYGAVRERRAYHHLKAIAEALEIGAYHTAVSRARSAQAGGLTPVQVRFVTAALKLAEAAIKLESSPSAADIDAVHDGLVECERAWATAFAAARPADFRTALRRHVVNCVNRLITNPDQQAVLTEWLESKALPALVGAELLADWHRKLQGTDSEANGAQRDAPQMNQLYALLTRPANPAELAEAVRLAVRIGPNHQLVQEALRELAGQATHVLSSPTPHNYRVALWYDLDATAVGHLDLNVRVGGVRWQIQVRSTEGEIRARPAPDAAGALRLPEPALAVHRLNDQWSVATGRSGLLYWFRQSASCRVTLPTTDLPTVGVTWGSYGPLAVLCRRLLRSGTAIEVYYLASDEPRLLAARREEHLVAVAATAAAGSLVHVATDDGHVLSYHIDTAGGTLRRLGHTVICRKKASPHQPVLVRGRGDSLLAACHGVVQLFEIDGLTSRLRGRWRWAVNPTDWPMVGLHPANVRVVVAERNLPGWHARELLLLEQPTGRPLGHLRLGLNIRGCVPVEDGWVIAEPFPGGGLWHLETTGKLRLLARPSEPWQVAVGAGSVALVTSKEAFCVSLSSRQLVHRGLPAPPLEGGYVPALLFSLPAKAPQGVELAYVTDQRCVALVPMTSTRPNALSVTVELPPRGSQIYASAVSEQLVVVGFAGHSKLIYLATQQGEPNWLALERQVKLPSALRNLLAGKPPLAHLADGQLLQVTPAGLSPVADLNAAAVCRTMDHTLWIADDAGTLYRLDRVDDSGWGRPVTVAKVPGQVAAILAVHGSNQVGVSTLQGNQWALWTAGLGAIGVPTEPVGIVKKDHTWTVLLRGGLLLTVDGVSDGDRGPGKRDKEEVGSNRR